MLDGLNNGVYGVYDGVYECMCDGMYDGVHEEVDDSVFGCEGRGKVE